ncbi:MAG: LAGLIDADG family homing endonuclease [Armatimonadota bacterium]
MHNPNEGLLELSESNGAVETAGTPVAVTAPMRTDGIRAERRYGFIPREKFDNINTGKGLRIQRYFTQPGIDPFDTVQWERRTAVITGERGEVVFEQKDVEVPAFWSQLATNVVASKYFRGQVGTPEREHSVRQVIGRVVETLTRWGREMNYFASDEDADAFRDELKHLLLYQYAAFNSPVWFNVGIEPRAQCSACFIVSVDDTMESILDLAKTEGMIFKFGSGSGSNLSRIRGSKEYLSGGGRASGPVSFMRGFDSFAGVIKSGGKTRRAAKMVVLNVDHPDIVDFIECKAKEEKKAWALIDAGYDPGFDTPGGAYDSVFFQNANHSVRVTDEFMRAVEEDGEWCTYARTTGEVMGRYKARELFRKIAEAAWVCGDPGLQFHDTTNRWHTVKNSGPINASNPCFTGDSLVYTNKGLIPFRELMMRVAQGESFMVYTHNKTASVPQEGVLLSEPTQFMVTGVNEVWRLRFSNGIEVRCTPNHRFFTLNRGMVRADELTPEDAVLVVDAPCLPVDASWSLPVPGDWRQFRAKGERHAQLNLPTEWSEPFAEMLGHLTGDGSFVPSSTMVILIYDTAEDQEQLLPRHRAVLESLGLRPNISRQANGTVQMRVTRAALNRFLEALGMRRVTAAEKRVPRALFQAPPEIVAAYLRGLFSADGCAHDDKTKGTRYIGLGSKSLALLQDVQQLLLMFGIQSRIYTQPPKRAGFRYTRKRDGKQVTYESKGNSYDLRITGPSILRFYHSIGFAVASKQQTLERWVQEHDFYAVRVDAHLVEREFVGYELTYNLTEPRHHTYIVNGLVVANCSEFVFLDDTACNLASLNLMKFRLPDGTFDVEAFRAAVRIMITAQEIIVDNSAYPTERICDNSHNFRPLGLGYANLGALLMSLGLPYDSDAGRAYAAIITAIMHGEAYRQSAIIARDCGAPFPGFALNREPMLEVMRMHADALNQIQASYVPDPLMKTARAIYDEMLQLGEQYGYRNAQVTVLAPTGTISFMMDCDTTGIEPDIALVKYKTLVGGGLLKIVNTTVPLALQRLGYSAEQIEAITRYIDEHDTIEGAPYLKEEHLPVFDCAFRPAKGTRSLAPMAHVKMMAAVQPFLSGAISKCVTGDTLLFTEKGIIPIAQLYQGEKPDTFRPCTLKLASIDEPQVADMFYYGGFRPTIRLTLQDGRTIEGTPNHRVKVANQHGYGWKRLDEIQPGDFVAIRIGAEMWASENARFDDFQPSAPWGCQKSIKLPREMTPELARLLGYYIAEGNLTRSNWTVRITNNDEGVLQHCQRLLHDLFGLESTIVIDARNGVKSVTVASKTLVEFLEYLGCAGNAAQKQIPWAVLQSRREVVQAFVGALWLDGYIRKDGMVAICLASETLLRQLQVVLNNFGLRANLIRKYSKTVDRFYYELTLFGEDVVRFAALFELDEAHKRERLADAVERANRNAGHTNPLPELKEIVENNIHFVPVVEIEHRFAPVYDLHVPGNHAFLGNAIINHNTVNMPSDTTPEDIENIYMQAWKLGLKAIAIYRDGSKRTQPLSTKKPEEETAPLPVPTERPVRRHLPDERKSITHKFSIAGHEGYITVGMYEDGTPGEIFITMAKEGSVISGLMDAFATAISLALQYGVPLEKLVEKFSYTRFQPSGFTNNPQIPVATSIVDYIFRWLGMKFLQKQPEQKQTLEALEEQPAPPAVSAAAQPETVGIRGAKETTADLTPTGQGETMDWSQLVKLQQDAPPCPVCGMIMVRAGACHQCLNCGTSYGCS